MAALTEWESHCHFVALFLAAALLRGELPLSLLLVAPPAEGKSTLMGRFRDWPALWVVSAVSKLALIDRLEKVPGTRLLLMDEFARIFSGEQSTVSGLCSLLLTLTSGQGGEEWLGGDRNGLRVDLTGKALGLVSAIPTERMRGYPLQVMRQTGMVSRVTCYNMRSSEREHERRTLNRIYGRPGDLAPYPVPPKLAALVESSPDGLVAVTMTPATARAFDRWRKRTHPKADLRTIGICLTLVRAIALMNGRTSTTVADVAEFATFDPFLLSLTFEGEEHIGQECKPLSRPPSWAR